MLKAKTDIEFIGAAALKYIGRFKLNAEDSEIEVLFARTGYVYDSNLLRRHPNLKIIASNTTNAGHIDEVYCESHGIRVITLAGDSVLYDITAVAEFTISLIVMLTRNIHQAVNHVKHGGWNRYLFGGTRMLSRMTLGVFGFGRIGSHVATRAAPMFRRVYIHDQAGGEATLNRVMGCDVVTLHIRKEFNTCLFDRDMIDRMKDGAYLINTSHPDIVDTDALVDALTVGRLAGVATDVLAGEFDPDFDIIGNRLWQYARNHDNAIITPHIGGSTVDAWEMTQERIIDKVCELSE